MGYFIYYQTDYDTIKILGAIDQKHRKCPQEMWLSHTATTLTRQMIRRIQTQGGEKTGYSGERTDQNPGKLLE